MKAPRQRHTDICHLKTWGPDSEITVQELSPLQKYRTGCAHNILKQSITLRSDKDSVLFHSGWTIKTTEKADEIPSSGLRVSFLAVHTLTCGSRAQFHFFFFKPGCSVKSTYRSRILSNPQFMGKQHNVCRLLTPNSSAGWEIMFKKYWMIKLDFKMFNSCKWKINVAGTAPEKHQVSDNRPKLAFQANSANSFFDNKWELLLQNKVKNKTIFHLRALVLASYQ